MFNRVVLIRSLKTLNLNSYDISEYVKYAI